MTVFDAEPTQQVEATTRAIRIAAIPVFLDGQSDPDEGRYLWAYDIQIENQGEETVQIVTRKWLITDSLGRTEMLTGGGIIGHNPVLGPGNGFRYQSGVPLGTPSGIMSGDFELENANGERFWVQVPTLSLDSPYDTSRPN